MQEGIEKSTPDKNGIYFYPNYRSLKQVSNPPPTLSTLTYQLPQISIILHPAPRYGFAVHFIDTTLPPYLIGCRHTYQGGVLLSLSMMWTLYDNMKISRMAQIALCYHCEHGDITELVACLLLPCYTYL